MIIYDAKKETKEGFVIISAECPRENIDKVRTSNLGIGTFTIREVEKLPSKLGSPNEWLVKKPNMFGR